MKSKRLKSILRSENLDIPTTDFRKYRKNHLKLMKERNDVRFLCNGVKTLIAAELLRKHYAENKGVLVSHFYLDLCRGESDRSDERHPQNVYRQGLELLERLKEMNKIDEITGRIDLDMSSAKAINNWKIEVDRQTKLSKEEKIKQLEMSLALPEDKEPDCVNNLLDSFLDTKIDCIKPHEDISTMTTEDTIRACINIFLQAATNLEHLLVPRNAINS